MNGKVYARPRWLPNTILQPSGRLRGHVRRRPWPAGPDHPQRRCAHIHCSGFSRIVRSKAACKLAVAARTSASRSLVFGTSTRSHAQAETNARFAHDPCRKEGKIERARDERRKRRRGCRHAEERHFHAVPFAQVGEEGDGPAGACIAHELERRRRLFRAAGRRDRRPAASPGYAGRHRDW